MIQSTTNKSLYYPQPIRAYIQFEEYHTVYESCVFPVPELRVNSPSHPGILTVLLFFPNRKLSRNKLTTVPDLSGCSSLQELHL